MAKHKKKRPKYVSKGERPNISHAHLKYVRQNSEDNTIANKLKAWMKGKRGYMTIANPNPEETNRRFIRVSLNQYFGGNYKDMKMRVKRSEDKNRIEV